MLLFLQSHHKAWNQAYELVLPTVRPTKQSCCQQEYRVDIREHLRLVVIKTDILKADIPFYRLGERCTARWGGDLSETVRMSACVQNQPGILDGFH